MSINFSPKEFFYPHQLIGKRRMLQRSQYYSADALEAFQVDQLKKTLSHAAGNVPYYRQLFADYGFDPSRFSDLHDLRKLPHLTKQQIVARQEQFLADNYEQYVPRIYKTSGTTGDNMVLYHDKFSRILEFCYYWRWWGWFGYKLRTSFADFSFHHFMDSQQELLYKYSPLTRRLILNPSQLSYENIQRFRKVLLQYKPRFLKGSPATLLVLASFLKEAAVTDVSFDAVFTTGDLITQTIRETVEQVLNTTVSDSYGQMERVVSISQCEHGSYHVHADYGYFEIEEDKELSTDDLLVGEVIGSTFYTKAMPLIRYNVRDLIQVRRKQQVCPCKRNFPVIDKLFGRTQDLVLTPDGRVLTNLFVLFSQFSHIEWFRFIQETTTDYVLHAVVSGREKERYLQQVVHGLKKIIGDTITVSCNVHESPPLQLGVKERPIVSKISNILP